MAFVNLEPLIQKLDELNGNLTRLVSLIEENTRLQRENAELLRRLIDKQ